VNGHVLGKIIWPVTVESGLFTHLVIENQWVTPLKKNMYCCQPTLHVAKTDFMTTYRAANSNLDTLMLDGILNAFLCLLLIFLMISVTFLNINCRNCCYL